MKDCGWAIPECFSNLGGFSISILQANIVIQGSVVDLRHKAGPAEATAQCPAFHLQMWKNLEHVLQHTVTAVTRYCTMYRKRLEICCRLLQLVLATVWSRGDWRFYDLALAVAGKDAGVPYESLPSSVCRAADAILTSSSRTNC